MDLCTRYGLRRVINAIGTPTIIGANTAAPEVVAAVAEALTINVEIDALQRAASGIIARVTGAEAGCITSSASSGLAIASAAAMTGADLAAIMRLPDTAGLRCEVGMHLAHDVNFGARISQMVRLSGARIVSIGTANHADAFQLRGALGEQTAAVLYVVNGAVHPAGDFVPLEQVVEIAAGRRVPVIVDAAAEPDVRPFLRAGADLVITSGHKAMGAPTSGVICGRKNLVRACYLQNWGIGRAMKVGKEGIFGAMAALERWCARDGEAERERYREIAAAIAERVPLEPSGQAHRVEVRVDNARQVANRLREGDPPVWVHDAREDRLVLDLRVLGISDARILAEALSRALAHPQAPREDVPYHDLYWSEERLLRWPD